MTARHIFIDETKERGYVVAASTHLAGDVGALRKMLRDELLLPGQARIHMAKERDQRRRKIVDTICRAGIVATVYDAANRYRDPLRARAACLDAVIGSISPSEQTLLVLEQDDSILQWDNQLLYRAIHDAGLVESVRYVHHRAKSELLLCVPDAVAWCWARGGEWRNRIKPAVVDVREV